MVLSDGSKIPEARQRVHFTQSRGLVWASGKKHLVGAGVLEEDEREGMMFLKVFIRLMDGNCDWQK